MKETGFRAVVCALVLSAIAGCNGSVVVEGSGGSGGAGTGAAGSTSSSTSTGTDGLCGSVCVAAVEGGCVPDLTLSQCKSDCLGSYQEYPWCEDELTALYVCAQGAYEDGCDFGGDACLEEAIAWNDCVGPVGSCGTNTFELLDETCSAEGFCDGKAVQVDCALDSSGVLCACMVDAEQVGTCYDSGLTCDLFEGCCSAYFPAP